MICFKHMENRAAVQSETTVNGCRVIDKGNGLSAFVPIEHVDASKDEDQPRGFFATILSWFKKSPVKPYAKVRDLADPLWKRHESIDDIDVGCDGKMAVEVGLKVDF